MSSPREKLRRVLDFIFEEDEDSVGQPEERRLPSSKSLARIKAAIKGRRPIGQQSIPGQQSLSGIRWTHPSVKRLAGDADPVQIVIQRARDLVLEATDKGWKGPPFDPVLLAAHLGIALLPCNDIEDARVVPQKGTNVKIEYNPNRPRHRIKYSIAHDLAHTLFPDCAEAVRNRLKRDEIVGNEWQLEMLCNIAAAELLMPFGVFPRLDGDNLNINFLIELGKEYEVSNEAVFMRAVKLTSYPCIMFSTRFDESSQSYSLEYGIPSKSWGQPVPRGLSFTRDSVIGECIAIGHTGIGDATWTEVRGKLKVECVGIPPYPGTRLPRVLGIARQAQSHGASKSQITELKGDATTPRGKGYRLIAHVVNDKTPRWGGGFALAVRKKWEHVQDDFVGWTNESSSNLSLGNIRFCEVDANLGIVHMISQHGYRPSSTPTIRYQALSQCLNKLSDILVSKNLQEVHMPRVGCGQAGGDWRIVKQLIEECLCERHISITIYDLPGRESPRVTKKDDLLFY